jgi:hypothetical protein
MQYQKFDKGDTFRSRSAEEAIMKMSITDWARKWGFPSWRVRRAYDAIRPGAPRVSGRMRLIDPTDTADLLFELRRRDGLTRYRGPEAAAR